MAVRMCWMTSSRDGVEIAYATHGAGSPAVVLVHGWAGNRTYWADQIRHLAERHQVIAVDLGGHGESGRGRVDWTLPAFGDDVVAVIDEVDVKEVVLVGHSMGGDAVVHAARRLGDRVVGLVWVDVFRSLGHETTSSPEEVEAFVAPFRDDFAAAIHRFVQRLLPETVDGRLVDRISTDMAATSREVALGSLRYARNREPAMLAALAHITVPIVAINPSTTPADVDSLGRHGVEPMLLEHVGHFPMLEAPHQFNVALNAALASFGC